MRRSISWRVPGGVSARIWGKGEGSNLCTGYKQYIVKKIWGACDCENIVIKILHHKKIKMSVKSEFKIKKGIKRRNAV